MQEKRINIITEMFYPHIGGQEIRYFEFGKVFVERGWDVFVYTINHNGQLPDNEIINGIHVHRIVKSSSYEHPFPFLNRNLFTILLFAKKLNPIMQNFSKDDVVIFNQWPLLPQILLSKAADQRTFVDWCELRSGQFWKFIQSLIARSAKKHLCVTSAIKRKLEENHGLSNENIKVLVSGINVSNYSYQKKTKTGVLFLGRLLQHKHPEHAIRAVLLLNRKTGRQETITVVGGGPMLEYLEQKYGQHESVNILGWVSHEQKLDILSTHKVHVLPSEREGFPRIVTECMACGIPTITTDYEDNGTKEVVREFNCGVVASPDIESIGNTLIELYENADIYDSYVASCLSRCKELDWQNLYDDFQNFIEA